MARPNPKNVRIKRQYYAYLEEAKRMASHSVDQVAAALDQFDASTGYKDFALFNVEQARKFKRMLADATNSTTGRPLSKSTTYHRLMAVRAFFQWLAGQPGYKSKLTYSDAEYFNPSNHDTHIAKAAHEKRIPTLEQIRHVLAVMPSSTDLEKRDRAVVAFTLLTGARDNAIASMQIAHVDIARRRIFQDARSVRTKFRKSFHSDFFPVGDEVEEILVAWVEHLTKTLLFGPSDPLFPSTKVAQDDSHQFTPVGLRRQAWSSAAPIRGIFRRAFDASGIPYFNPHSFRDCLVDLGSRICTTPEQFKAWSQNLGHDHVATTLTNYGAVTSDRQSELIRSLGAQASLGHLARPDLSKTDVERIIAALMDTQRAPPCWPAQFPATKA